MRLVHLVSFNKQLFYHQLQESRKPNEVTPANHGPERPRRGSGADQETGSNANHRAHGANHRPAVTTTGRARGKAQRQHLEREPDGEQDSSLLAGDEGQPEQEPVDEDVDRDRGPYAHCVALGEDISRPAWHMPD